uniref:COesterase domain-containing protein n=1 Tax=Heterorhabditis bacteriophora TaxID=37862 RepID=A0A1I7XD90_HETBA
MWVLLAALAVSVAMAQQGNLFGTIVNYIPIHLRPKMHHEWLNSGKFQGDIDGIDVRLLQEPNGSPLFNAMKNKQLTWPEGIIPYEMDSAFCK